MELRDEDLMRDVQAGRFESFELLVNRYRAPLLRLAGSKLSDASAAEDVVQETFLAVFAARRSYRLESPFRTWLWTIALNLCKRHARRSARQRLSPRPMAGGALTVTVRGAAPHDSWGAKTDSLLPNSLEQLLWTERQEQLRAALGRLPEVQADALRLRFFGGLKFEEIAAAMECSLNGAKMRVKHGLLKLAELLPAPMDREP